ncbi:MAG: hypothetical protein M3409_02895 [Gemmatimonadota bacterium]|jgi:hypothetical protein|nr:hypothetical protein [Gemmatimonadota bacterium]
MGENGTSAGLRVVDGLDLDPNLRRALRPGEILADGEGRGRRLPRFFWEVESWDQALETAIAPDFHLWEFMDVDVREVEVLRRYPRYVPCAVTLLAAHLALFRKEVDTYVHVAANGGYRSPSHALSRGASPHCWGTAANVYRVGDGYPDTQETVERFNALACAVSPGIWTRPWGHGAGEADDHIHLDLGYVLVVPRGTPGETDAEDEPR